MIKILPILLGLINPQPVMINGSPAIQYITEAGDISIKSLGDCVGCEPRQILVQNAYTVKPPAFSTISSTNIGSVDGVCQYNHTTQNCDQQNGCFVKTNIIINISLPPGWRAGLWSTNPFVFLGWQRNGLNGMLLGFRPGCGGVNILDLTLVFFDANNNMAGVHSATFFAKCTNCFLDSGH